LWLGGGKEDGQKTCSHRWKKNRGISTVHDLSVEGCRFNGELSELPTSPTVIATMCLTEVDVSPKISTNEEHFLKNEGIKAQILTTH
jgi:hypothetical protein